MSHNGNNSKKRKADPLVKAEPRIKTEPLDEDMDQDRPPARDSSEGGTPARYTRDAVKVTVPDIPIDRIWDYANATKGNINRINVSLKIKGTIPKGLSQSVSLFINYIEASALTAASIPKNKKYEFMRTLKMIRDGDTTINGVETPFTPNIKARASILCDLYDTDIVDDAADLDLDSDEDEDIEATASTRIASGGGGNRSVRSSKGKGKKASGDRIILKPRPTHPIFGDNGPMRGMTYSVNKKTGKNKSYVFNDDYALERRNPNVVGSNGIAPSTWYPNQLAALLHGAHGSRMGGIAGPPKEGAYSIVVSGMYSDLDVDKGDTIYYSGSKSHDNANPDTPIETDATNLLKLSRRKGNLVRVLRSSSSGGQQHRWCPRGGLRYDGLYEVVDQEIRKNKLGGAYYQFKLVRRDTWPIDVTVPSQQQIESLAAIRAAVI